VKVIKLSAIDSTNSYLKALNAEMDVADRTIVWAESQTRGRGQRELRWQSKAGESLTFSILKRFSGLDSKDQFYVSMAVSIAVANTLKEFLVANVKIKWPNDILSDSKKLCGILIENQLKSGKLNAAVIGIGLNVNDDELEGLPKAGSVYQVTGVKFVLEDVFSALTSEIAKQLDRLENDNLEALKREYESALFRRDEITVFETAEGERFNGIIRGINPLGLLLLDTEKNGVIEFGTKEITMLY
jgi:BirA family biotin operon repressor/biotin-[acetyl-CoA-carboxylase] ligase